MAAHSTEVDKFIAAFPEHTRKMLETVRKTIREAAPDAEEHISYMMPAYKFHGVLVYFSGYKNHIGFYPGASGVAHFSADIAKYKTAKGSIQFPLDEPVPVTLIDRIVAFRIQENLDKAAAKLKKKEMMPDWHIRLIRLVTLSCLVALIGCNAAKTNKNTAFKVIAFYTAKNDQAHISFVSEANEWLPKMASDNGFQYDATDDWSKLNAEFLSQYQVVLFLDTRPEKAEQRNAFEKYMKNGGAWMGFHFAAFALNDSDVKQDWDWYHNEFLGSGEYVSNMWRPTSAILRKMDNHAATADLPESFITAPNEWYRWQHDLRKNPDIDILYCIDPLSFPLGTGPKLHEIWHDGVYPVVWSNKKYRMVYCNMGHNDIDYEGGTNRTLSFSFGNETERKFITESILWLGRKPH